MLNGDVIESVGTYGKIVIPELNVSKDGFIETFKGVDEIVLGVGLQETSGSFLVTV